MKIITKPLALLGIILLKAIGATMNLFANLSSIVAGPFLVFILGFGIYYAVTANWKHVLILAIVGGVVLLLYMLMGLLLGLIDIAGERMVRFMKTAR